MALDVKKFIPRFVDEAREHLGGLERGLVQLEKNPTDAETIDAIFRAAHTIKGSSRMLKLLAIGEVSHRLEDALGALRERRLTHSKELASVLFKAIDAIRAMVEKVSAGESLTEDHKALCEELVRASEGKLSPAAEETKPAPPAAEVSTPPAPPALPEPPPSRSEAQAVREEPLSAAQAPRMAPEEQSLPQPAVQVQSSETIRVRSEKLDDLIRLMGEVVSHQNKLKQRIVDLAALESRAKKVVEWGVATGSGKALTAAQSLHAGLKELLSVLRQDKTLQDILTSEFQEKSLMLRMVPLSVVFEPLPRLVRDISESLRKEVDFVLAGGDIELDKKIVEKLGDPLLHMLRNSIDHGIEEPATRQSFGKPRSGKVKLAAAYDSGSIVIELSDDGAGISLAKLRERALARRLFDAPALESMPDSTVLDLIFLPGFSTSVIITDVSGRGVGMDVVKKNLVEDLKGSVKVDTKPGQGTTFTIRLPMTLAIMRILLVSVRELTFGISTHYVTEIIRVPASEIVDVVGRKAIRLREEFIPVADLGDVLGVREDGRTKSGSPLLLISQVAGEKFAFIIDAVLDDEDAVIKPLPDHMKGVRIVSGVTISGRNEIINILNIPAVIQQARSMGAARAESRAAPEQQISILVVDDSINTREIEKSILEAYGYLVTLAGDGMEALELTGATLYDLVITDIEMPKLDGFSLTERLRSDPTYRDVPIIIVTSRGKEEDKRRGIAVGANAYIVKGGFDQTNLVETVQNLVGKGKG